MAERRICIAITKKGLPCPTRVWNGTQYCIGHDPSITKETRAAWRQASVRAPRYASPDYRYMTPSEIIHYCSAKIDLFEKKYGEQLEAMGVIADFLRVAIQANRLLQSKSELEATKKGETGPRTVRLVRDEVDSPAANAG